MTTYPRSGMQRVLVGSVNPVLRVTLADQDGNAEAAASTLTANIERADGTSIATGRATAGGGSTGACTVALTTAEAASLDVLKVTWLDGAATRMTTYHRIVGGFLFARAQLAARPGMANYSTADLDWARDAITDLIERETGTSWCPAYDLDEFEGTGRCTLLARRPTRALRSLSVDGTAQTVADFDVDADVGVIRGTVALWGRIAVGVEHGFDAPPADLRREAITAAAYGLSAGSDTLAGPRVRSISSEFGLQQLSFAGGRDHPTGIDSVDAAIRANDRRIPGLA